MRKLTEKMIGKLLPKATGKAVAARGKCVAGCSSYGVWIEYGGRQTAGRRPCC